MALLKTVIEIKDIQAQGLAGYPASWPPAALPIEMDLGSVQPLNIVSYVSPGRGAVAASPIQSRDAGSETRRWTAQTVGTTLVQDSGVLAGLPRWSFNGADNGLYGDLDAALTDYTIAMLVRTPTIVGIKALFNLGTVAGTRLLTYVTADDVALQHGTGDVKTTTGSAFVANTWQPLVFSYKNSTKALNIYGSTTTPLLSATMTNSPPADLLGSWGSLRAGGQPFSGEIALGAIWNVPLSETPADLAKVITALNSLKTL